MNRPITPDIERAVELLKPICDELGWSLEADGSVMTIDGQKIGVSCNSTYAFSDLLFEKLYSKED